MSFDQFFFLQIIPISLRIILFFLSNYNSSKKKIYYSFSLIIRLLKVFNKRTLKKSFVSRLRLYLSILYSFEIEKARNTPIPPNFKASKKEKNQKSNTLARRKRIRRKKINVYLNRIIGVFPAAGVFILRSRFFFLSLFFLSPSSLSFVPER